MTSLMQSGCFGPFLLSASTPTNSFGSYMRVSTHWGITNDQAFFFSVLNLHHYYKMRRDAMAAQPKAMPPPVVLYHLIIPFPFLAISICNA